MTSPRPEHWFLCGGVTAANAPSGAVSLVAADSFGHPRDITVDIAGITEALHRNLPLELRDLILIAAYVLTADGAVTRGDPSEPDYLDRFHRQFRFVIGVDKPDFWNSVSVREQLEETLGFLSGDTYSFEFKPAGITVSEQLQFAPPDGAAWTPLAAVEEVALLSGGLDSLTGAAELILGAGKRLALVSHRSSEKVHRHQRDLVQQLRNRAPAAAPDHVNVRVVKHRQELRRERTQRSRSFLYAAI